MSTIKRKRSLRKNTEKFIEDAILVHGKTYNYSLAIYNGCRNGIKIICNMCNITFEQTASDHLSGYGCRNCYNKQKTKTSNEFIKESILIHNSLYDYSLVKYIRNNFKIEIICKKCNNIFLQTPRCHLQGRGCPDCNQPGFKYEPKLFKKIKEEFAEENIVSQITPEWLKSNKKGRQSFDIFFPDKNIAIEYQGEQHFKPIKAWGGHKKYLETVERDKKKFNLSIENNCKLFYFTYSKKNIPATYFDKVYSNEQELINEIEKLL